MNNTEENTPQSNQEVPAENTAETPAENTPETPTENTPETPAENAPETPAENAESPAPSAAPSEPAATAPAAVAEEPVVEQEPFDWDNVSTKGFGDGYSDSEKAELVKLYEETLTEIEEKEVVKGRVVGISDRDVILNIGFKSDGLISASEFRDLPDLKIGDEVEVYIEEQENVNGQLVLSRKKAKIVQAWKNIQDAYENDSVIESTIKRRTKGGLIADIYGVEAFLPGSQIDVKPIRDFDVFVDKAMEVKVVKINYANDNVVVSHKVLIEKDLEKQRAEILNNLEKGQVLEGCYQKHDQFWCIYRSGWCRWTVAHNRHQLGRIQSSRRGYWSLIKRST